MEMDRRVAGVGVETRAYAGPAPSEAGIKDVVGVESSAPHPDSPSCLPLICLSLCLPPSIPVSNPIFLFLCLLPPPLISLGPWVRDSS